MTAASGTRRTSRCALRGPDTSPDGCTAVYTPGPEGSDEYSDQVLLESATGTVRYRTGRNPEIVQPDSRTPVLRREVPGGDAQLIVRDLSTRAAHPLSSNCPALHTADSEDARSTFVSPIVTAASVLVLCFDARSGRATIDSAGPPDEPWHVELIPAVGAVALLVQNWHATPAQVVGLA
jgi:hypothetical protein